MKKKTKLIFTNLLAMVLILICLPVSNVSALENVVSSNKETIEQQNVSNPAPVYVTKTVRNFKTSIYPIPPGYYHEARVINGLKYSGRLTRFSYANAGEYWLVTYKGYITAD